MKLVKQSADNYLMKKSDRNVEEATLESLVVSNQSSKSFIVSEPTSAPISAAATSSSCSNDCKSSSGIFFKTKFKHQKSGFK
jgi:hypothetical protein